MSSLMIHHKVADFATWKKAYDEHESVRTQGGVTHARVYQSAENPNDVTALMDFNTVEQAKSFIGSVDLKLAMEKAGVVGPPEFRFLNEA